MPIDPSIPRDVAAESLLAVMDVEAILDPERKIRLTQEMREQADRVPDKIASQIRRFLVASEPEKAGPMAEFHYATAMRLLTEFDPEQRITALEMRIQDGEAGEGVVVAAGRAIKYLKDILPSKARLLVTGPEPVQPNDLVKYRFRRAWAVVEAPLGLFEALQEGAMSRDQVRTFKFVYPALYERAEETVVLELARLKGDRPNVQLDRWKVRQVENLLLTRSWTPELTRVMQEAFKAQDKAPAKPSGGLSDKASLTATTPVQRAEAK